MNPVVKINAFGTNSFAPSLLFKRDLKEILLEAPFFRDRHSLVKNKGTCRMSLGIHM